MPQVSVLSLYFSVDLPAEKVAMVLRQSDHHVSVDAPFAEGEDNSLLDVMSNADTPNTDHTLVSESLAMDIERALSGLTERERNVVKLFFGIGTQAMTLDEIADRFGLTRERVRQVKEKALRQLRKPSRCEMLKGYL